VKPTDAQLDALAERDPVLGKAMEGVTPFPGFPRGVLRGTHFHALARSIIFQQLATPAARTIYERVRDLTRGRKFPKAPDILAMSDPVLRSAGLSASKVKALKDLADKSESGEVNLRSIGRYDNDEIVDRLTRVWGIGEWTAQMFLLFKLGRLDVMAPGDLGLREGMRILDGLDERPSARELEERSGVWRPLRSVAAWTLWRLVDAED